MKEKRKRIGRTRPKSVNKVGMEIRLNITMEVIEGQDILINGVFIGKRSKDYLYLNNVSYSKRQLSKELGQLCSNYKIIVIEKESFFFGASGLSPRQSAELEENFLFSNKAK